ncbi:MAG: hypothetical protein FWC70_03475 [Defluviitaleaceae bacterium]|nr:hypothetical protein [Defluviitaleaceae bacterium]
MNKQKFLITALFAVIFLVFSASVAYASTVNPYSPGNIPSEAWEFNNVIDATIPLSSTQGVHYFRLNVTPLTVTFT